MKVEEGKRDFNGSFKHMNSIFTRDIAAREVRFANRVRVSRASPGD